MPGSAEEKAARGRPSKGDRHAFRAPLPRAEAITVIEQSRELHTSCNDYIAYLVGRALGVTLPMEKIPPHSHRATPEMVTESQHVFVPRIPRIVADLVIADADRLGMAKSDYVVQLVSHELGGHAPLPNRDDQEAFDLQTAS